MPLSVLNLGLIAVLVGAAAALTLLVRRRLTSRRALERRVHELEALADVSRAIAQAPLDVDALCDLIHRKATQIVDTHSFQIGLFEDHIYDIRIWVRDGRAVAPERFDLSHDGGLVGWVRESGQPLLVRDFERERSQLPARPRYLSDRPPRSAVFVPILAGSQTVGALSIQSNNPNAFGEDDLRLLQIVANQAGPIIANARLLEAAQQRATQLQLIGEVSREVAAILDLDVLFERVVELIQWHFNYYFVGLILREEDSDHLVFAGATAEAMRGRRVEVGQGIIGSVVATGEPLLVNDVSSHPLYIGLASLEETRSELAVPLILGKTILGALDVESSEQNAFTDEDIFILRTLADQVAIAAHEARLYAAEREQAWISTALLQVAEATSRASSLEEVLQTVARITPMLSGVDRCGILLWDPARGEYRAASSFGLGHRTAAFESLRVADDDWPEMRAAAEANATLQLEQPAGWLADAFGAGPTLALPLYARGERAGVMLVGSPEGSQLPTRKAALIAGIANQAALAIESAHLFASQREEAWVNMALLQVAEAVGSQTDLRDILSTVVRLTPLLVGVEVCLIFLRDSRRGVITGGDAHGVPRDRMPALAALEVPEDAWFGPDGSAQVPDSICQRLGLRAPVAWNLLAKGDVVGVLAIDGEAGTLSLDERRSNILAGIASQTAMAIVNAQLAEEAAVRERLEQELQVARKIQESFLPLTCPDLAGWEIAAFWRVARQVGGDFYDFIPLRDETDRLGIAIADVADKGVPAALFMALCRTLLRAVAIGGRGAAEALARTNDLILNDVRSDLFVTIFYLLIGPADGNVQYANAGHNPPMLVRAGSASIEYLTLHGAALGLMTGIDLQEYSARLDPGDMLVLYTDGVTEAVNEVFDEFGLEQLARAVLSRRDGGADEVVRAVRDAIRAHVGDEPPFDDITLVVLKRTRP